MSPNTKFRRALFATLTFAVLLLARPQAQTTVTVCAVGCTYTNGNLQTAINAVAAGSTILLQEGFTYVGDFTLPVKAGAGAGAITTIRTGVNSTGTVQATTRYAATDIRICPSTFNVDWYDCSTRPGSQDMTRIAKLQPANNNAPALATIATGSGTPVSYYHLQWLEFIPQSFAGNALVVIANNTAPSNGDPATMLPHHITMDRIVVGSTTAAQFRGVQIGGNSITLKNSHLFTQHTSEGQTIWANDGIGPLDIINNYASGGTEVFLTGGGGTQISPSFTVTASPSPTTTVFGLSGTTDLYVGKSFAIHQRQRTVTSIATAASGGSVVTTSTAHGYALDQQADFNGVSGCAAAGGSAYGGSINSAAHTITEIISSTTFRMKANCDTVGTGGTVTIRASAEVTALAGSTVTVTPALPYTPATGELVETSTVLRNMTFRYNVFTRPSSWRTSNPNGWQVKNTFELKQGRDSVFEYNLVEHAWQAGQNGPCLIFTGTQQMADGDSAVVRNIDVRYNVIRRCGQYYQMSTRDALGHESGRSGMIRIKNNLFYEGGQPYSATYGFFITGGGGGPRLGTERAADAMQIEHNTFAGTTTGTITAPPTFMMMFDNCHSDLAGSPKPESLFSNFIFRNNIIYAGLYGLGSVNNNPDCDAGTTIGRFATSGPMGAGSVIDTNVLVGTEYCGLYTNQTNLTCATDEAAFNTSTFTNTTSVSGFKVKNTSAHYAGGSLDATDGASMGADITTIEAAMLVIESGDADGAVQEPVTPALTITTSSPLPEGFVGQAYSVTLAATGGTTPYTWARTAGTLPAGLTLNTSTGVLSGTPTATVSATSLTFRVTDSTPTTPQQVSKVFALTISPCAKRGTRYNWSWGGFFVQNTKPTAGSCGDQAKSGDLWYQPSTQTHYKLAVSGTTVTETSLASGGGGASILNDLTDVVLTSPQTGQVLKFNGTNWINDTDATGAGGGATGAPAVQTITLWAGAAYTQTPAASAVTATNEFAGQRNARLKADVENSTQCAINVSLVEGSSVAGNLLKLQYWNGSNWQDAGCSAAIDVAGPVIIEGAFGTLDAAARTQDRIFRLFFSSGDGADPVTIGTTQMRLR